MRQQPLLIENNSSENYGNKNWYNTYCGTTWKKLLWAIGGVTVIGLSCWGICEAASNISTHSHHSTYPNTTQYPSIAPYENYTNTPTISALNISSIVPTIYYPTGNPTISPSVNPIEETSIFPTSVYPTNGPSSTPSSSPSISPSLSPSHTPTKSPSLSPSGSPSLSPSINPTNAPNVPPTKHPSLHPTHSPSNTPSVHPTSAPTIDVCNYVSITNHLNQITDVSVGIETPLNIDINNPKNATLDYTISNSNGNDFLLKSNDQNCEVTNQSTLQCRSNKLSLSLSKNSIFAKESGSTTHVQTEINCSHNNETESLNILSNIFFSQG